MPPSPPSGGVPGSVASGEAPPSAAAVEKPLKSPPGDVAGSPASGSSGDAPGSPGAEPSGGGPDGSDPSGGGAEGSDPSGGGAKESEPSGGGAEGSWPGGGQGSGFLAELSLQSDFFLPFFFDGHFDDPSLDFFLSLFFLSSLAAALVPEAAGAAAADNLSLWAVGSETGLSASAGVKPTRAVAPASAPAAASRPMWMRSIGTSLFHLGGGTTTGLAEVPAAPGRATGQVRTSAPKRDLLPNSAEK